MAGCRLNEVAGRPLGANGTSPFDLFATLFELVASGLKRVHIHFSE